jgi:hypothetical protein
VKKLIQRMREELVRRNYAESTMRTYLQVVEDFRRYSQTRLDQRGPDDMMPRSRSAGVSRCTTPLLLPFSLPQCPVWFISRSISPARRSARTGISAALRSASRFCACLAYTLKRYRAVAQVFDLVHTVAIGDGFTHCVVTPELRLRFNRTHTASSSALAGAPSFFETETGGQRLSSAAAHPREIGSNSGSKWVQKARIFAPCGFCSVVL